MKQLLIIQAKPNPSGKTALGMLFLPLNLLENGSILKIPGMKIIHYKISDFIILLIPLNILTAFGKK